MSLTNPEALLIAEVIKELRKAPFVDMATIDKLYKLVLNDTSMAASDKQRVLDEANAASVKIGE